MELLPFLAIVAVGLAASTVVLAVGLRRYRTPAATLVRDLATWAAYALVPVASTLLVWAVVAAIVPLTL